MSKLLGDGGKEEVSPILKKIKEAPNFKFSTMEKPLLELSIKFKTLISYKPRYMKIFENFMLIYKVIFQIFIHWKHFLHYSWNHPQNRVLWYFSMRISVWNVSTTSDSGSQRTWKLWSFAFPKWKIPLIYREFWRLNAIYWISMATTRPSRKLGRAALPV